ncbi:hypothetical protein FA95DRAFT_1003642 [Auriscalpium vulgare]|uniref:Uncharacterized protein n=1 Tax=Auriscalpium vulgare TaxID=40419 RepID=A0ACB8R6V4_9AGAM|nr:hypothetical protein FA95DRAFT_1003642 [Auriscalpium vulgare]
MYTRIATYAFGTCTNPFNTSFLSLHVPYPDFITLPRRAPMETPSCTFSLWQDLDHHANPSGRQAQAAMSKPPSPRSQTHGGALLLPEISLGNVARAFRKDARGAGWARQHGGDDGDGGLRCTPGRMDVLLSCVQQNQHTLLLALHVHVRYPDSATPPRRGLLLRVPASRAWPILHRSGPQTHGEAFPSRIARPTYCKQGTIARAFTEGMVSRAGEAARWSRRCAALRCSPGRLDVNRGQGEHLRRDSHAWYSRRCIDGSGL